VRDQEAIFELGFTRKPGGRGLGLHISREVLDRVGYTLQLDPPGSDSGATFRIGPKTHSPSELRARRTR
jgi:signal transduction histidine kinase